MCVIWRGFGSILKVRSIERSTLFVDLRVDLTLLDKIVNFVLITPVSMVYSLHLAILNYRLVDLCNFCSN